MNKAAAPLVKKCALVKLYLFLGAQVSVSPVKLIPCVDNKSVAVLKNTVYSHWRLVAASEGV